MYVWVGKLELPEDEAGVGSKKTEACDENDPSVRTVRQRMSMRFARGITHGTIPTAARTDGSDSMPKEIVSAIIIIPACLQVDLRSSEIRNP